MAKKKKETTEYVRPTYKEALAYSNKSNASATNPDYVRPTYQQALKNATQGSSAQVNTAQASQPTTMVDMYKRNQANSATQTTVKPATVTNTATSTTTNTRTSGGGYKKTAQDLYNQREQLEMEKKNLEAMAIPSMDSIARTKVINDELDSVNNQIKSIGADVDISGLERTGRAIWGGTLNYAGGKVGTAAASQQIRANNNGYTDYMVDDLNVRLKNAELTAQTAMGLGDTAGAQAAQEEAETLKKLIAGFDPIAQNEQNIANQLHSASQSLTKKGQENIETASQGLGYIGRSLVQAGASTTQTLLDAGENALFAAAGINVPKMLGFGTRAFGQSFEDAWDKTGGDFDKSFSYAAAQTAKEIVTEKIMNMSPLGKAAYSNGVRNNLERKVSDAIINATERWGKTEGGKLAVKYGLETVESFLEEGLEEAVGDVIEYVLNFEGIVDEDRGTVDALIEQAVNDFIVGGLSGLMGSGGSLAKTGVTATKNAVNDVNTARGLQESYSPESEGGVSLAQQLINNGKESAIGSSAQNYANELQSLLDKGKNVSDRKLGKLARLTTQSEFNEVASNDLIRQGVTEQDADNRADIIDEISTNAEAIEALRAEGVYDLDTKAKVQERRAAIDTALKELASRYSDSFDNINTNTQLEDNVAETGDFSQLREASDSGLYKTGTDSIDNYHVRGKILEEQKQTPKERAFKIAPTIQENNAKQGEIISKVVNQNFGESGRKVYNNYAVQHKDNVSKFYDAFKSFHDAGLIGEDIANVKLKYSTEISNAEAYAAYYSGVNDAKANPNLVKTVDTNYGIVENDYSSSVDNKIKKAVNNVAKAVGVKVELVGATNEYNGKYDPITQTVYVASNSDKPILTVLMHEVTHRLEDIAPKSYAKYRQLAYEFTKDSEIEALRAVYKAVGKPISEEGLINEITARYTEKLFKANDEFAKLNNRDPRTASDLSTALERTIKKIGDVFSGEAKELREAKRRWDAVINEARETVESGYSTVNNIKVNPKFDLSEQNHDSLVNSAMTMKEAERMINSTFNANELKDWYDGEYKDGIEWARDRGADEVGMYIENTYELQEKYINNNKYIGDVGDDYVDISEVVEAYLNGTLVGHEKAKPTRIDTSKSNGIVDSRFYAPKSVDILKDTWELAKSRITNANKSKVMEARKTILFASHGEGAESSLGVTASELNKQVRVWSNYSAKAKEIFNRLNSNVAIENQWTGIPNCSFLSKQSVDDAQLLSMVKSIDGESLPYERNYIARTMLALDTHINWSYVSFEFVRGKVQPDRPTVRGDYSPSTRKIRVGAAGSLNTVAHEMGHYLDTQWALDLLGRDGAKSSFSYLTMGINEDLIINDIGKQFYDNFKAFINDLTDSNDIRSSYTQSANEVFARFVARFVEWTDKTAGGNIFNESSSYNDKFTVSQFLEFAKLLQEKSAFDNSITQEVARYDLKDNSVFNELYEVMDDGRIKARNVADLSTEDWGLIYKATKKLGYDIRSAADAKEVFGEHIAAHGFKEDQSAAIMQAYGVSEKPTNKTNPARVTKAKRRFGTTADFREAGYLLPDGSMLDFSGAKWGGSRGTRALDHREINSVFNETLGDEFGYGDSTKYMNAFISEGNIRLMETQGVTIGELEPTTKQYATLKKFAEHVIDNEGYFYLDLANNRGSNIAEREYAEGDSASKVINDIKAYFKNGELPYRSDLQQFRYDLKEKYVKQINKWDEEVTGFAFTVGFTSKALQKAGVPRAYIKLDSSKAKNLLNKHDGMSKEVLKQVYDLLENPVIVIDSKQVADARLVMGDLTDENGKTVTCVILLNPKTKKGRDLDIIKVTSVEGRGHIGSLFTDSNNNYVGIRYVDKEKIQDWLFANRLQLPLRNHIMDFSKSFIPQEAQVRQDGIQKNARGWNIGDENQISMDFGSTQYNADEQAFLDSIKQTEDNLERKGRDLYFSSMYVRAARNKNPKINFVERIAKNDATVEQEIRDLVSKIDDLKLLENISLYGGAGYQKGFKKAVNKFRKIVAERSYVVGIEQGGRDLGLENGRIYLRDVEKLFNELNSVEALKPLAEKVFKTCDYLNVTFRVENSLFGAPTSGIAGEAIEGFVQYKAKYLNDPTVTNQRKATTLLHEAIHACTNYAIDLYKNDKNALTNSMQKAVEGLLEVYSQVREDADLAEMYGSTSESELLAELADPEFREALQKKSLLQEIFDAIKGLFGITKKEQTLFDAVDGILDYMLDDADIIASEISNNEAMRYFNARDIRYDLKDPTAEDIAIFRQANKNAWRIAEQNVELRKKLESLNGTKAKLRNEQKKNEKLKAQFKQTTESLARPEDCRKYAKYITERVGSSANLKETASEIEALVNHMFSASAENPLAWEDLYERAVNISRRLVEETFVEKEIGTGEKEALNIIRSTRFAVGENTKGGFNNYNEFRLSNFGKLNLARQGREIDDVWKDICEILGMDENSISSPADQLMWMADFVESYDDIREHVYCADEIGEAIDMYASMILDETLAGWQDANGNFQSIEQKPATYADRAERAVGRAKAHGAEMVRKIREEKNAEIEALKNENKQIRNDSLNAIREIIDKENRVKNDALLANTIFYKSREARLSREFKERTAAAARARQESADRKRLLKLVKRMQNLKTTAANKAMIKAVIGDVDTFAVSMLGWKRVELEYMERWRNAEKARYEEEHGQGSYIPDPKLEASIERLKKTQLADFTPYEVSELMEALLYIENSIRTEKKLIDTEDRRMTYEQVSDTIIKLKSMKQHQKLSKLELAELAPMRMFNKLVGYDKTNPLYQRFADINTGARKAMAYRLEANKKFAKLLNDSEFVKKFDGKTAEKITIKAVDFETKQPVEVAVTPSMMVSLYLHSLNDDNMRHILGGGIEIPNFYAYIKGDMKDANRLRKKVVLQRPEIQAYADEMFKKDRRYREFADITHEYFNGMSRDAINEVSEKLKGYGLASVEDYFPIKVDQNYRMVEFNGIKMDVSLESAGYLKERVLSTKPIKLYGANKVVADAIRDHSNYYGLAIPIKNFTKVWGGTLTKNASSVQDAMFDVWGEEASAWVQKYMEDIQSASKHEPSIFSKIASNYAGAVLTLNASVALKQAASYPTAGSVVGMKPLIKALLSPKKVDESLINKYTPLFENRTLGYSTFELGELAKSGKHLPKILNWIQATDVATTRKLWRAAEIYVRDNFKNLSVNTDEFYKQTAEVYNRIIEETQPNYDVSQRPQLLRSEGEFKKYVFGMFKTQSFQNFNITYEAISEYNVKRNKYISTKTNESKAEMNEAKEKLGMALISQAIQTMVFAGIDAGMKAILRKKDYENIWEFLKELWSSIVSSIAGEVTNLQALINILDSIKNGTTYYGLEVAPVEMVNDVANGIIKAFSGISKLLDEDSDYAMTDYARDMNKSLLLPFSQFAGVPLSGIETLGKAAYSYGAEMINGKYYGRYLRLRIDKNPSSSAAYYDLLFEAYENDMDAYKMIKSDMIKSGDFKKDNIENAIKKRRKKANGEEEETILQKALKKLMGE